MMRKKYPFRFSMQNIDEGWINLTPLIDVVFVVLVAFILIAPLLEIDQINLATSGTTSQKDLSGKGDVCIYVRGDNSIWINNQPVKTTELVSKLKELKRKYPAQYPSLFHDSKATFGTYQSVKNAVEAAGFEQLNIFLQSTN